MNTAVTLEAKALLAAKNAAWKKAAELNQLILRKKNRDIAALNRLARAFQEMGQKNKAVCTYKKVLEIDQSNQIAQRNLKKLACGHKRKKPTSNGGTVSFLEEKGRTKMVRLVKPAPPDLLITLHCTEEVVVVPKRKSIIIKDCTGRYLGALPDDIGFRLNRLMEKGNTYRGWVKSVEEHSLIVFLKEMSRCPQLAKTPSFPKH